MANSPSDRNCFAFVYLKGIAYRRRWRPLCGKPNLGEMFYSLLYLVIYATAIDMGYLASAAHTAV